MTRMTGPDCAVMCNLINTNTSTLTIIRQEEKKKTNDMQCTQFHKEEIINNIEGLEADGKRTCFPKGLFYASSAS